MRSYEFSKDWRIKQAKRKARENKRWADKSGPVFVRHMTDEERENTLGANRDQQPTVVPRPD